MAETKEARAKEPYVKEAQARVPDETHNLNGEQSHKCLEVKGPVVAKRVATFKLDPATSRQVTQCLELLKAAGLQLILHFDFNNTIVTRDSTARHANFEGTLNETLSKAALGTEVNILDCYTYWVPYTSNPFASRGRADEISWYEFQRKKTPENEILKPKAAQFVTTVGKYLREEFELMKRQGEAIFEAFYVMREAFAEVPIVIRSFGLDIDSAIDELVKTGVATDSDAVRRYYSKKGEFLTFQPDEGGPGFTPSQFVQAIVADPKIYKLASIKEDFDFWKAEGKKPECGKIICGTPGAFQIGFDDLDCMVARGEHAVTHRINTFVALTTPDFFVRQIVGDVFAALGSRPS